MPGRKRATVSDGGPEASATPRGEATNMRRPRAPKVVKAEVCLLRNMSAFAAIEDGLKVDVLALGERAREAHEARKEAQRKKISNDPEDREMNGFECWEQSRGPSGKPGVNTKSPEKWIKRAAMVKKVLLQVSTTSPLDGLRMRTVAAFSGLAKKSQNTAMQVEENTSSGESSAATNANNNYGSTMVMEEKEEEFVGKMQLFVMPSSGGAWHELRKDDDLSTVVRLWAEKQRTMTARRTIEIGTQLFDLLSKKEVDEFLYCWCAHALWELCRNRDNHSGLFGLNARELDGTNDNDNDNDSKNSRIEVVTQMLKDESRILMDGVTTVREVGVAIVHLLAANLEPRLQRYLVNHSDVLGTCLSELTKELDKYRSPCTDISPVAVGLLSTSRLLLVASSELRNLRCAERHAHFFVALLVNAPDMAVELRRRILHLLQVILSPTVLAAFIRADGRKSEPSKTMPGASVSASVSAGVGAVIAESEKESDQDWGLLFCALSSVITSCSHDLDLKSKFMLVEILSSAVACMDPVADTLAGFGAEVAKLAKLAADPRMAITLALTDNQGKDEQNAGQDEEDPPVHLVSLSIMCHLLGCANECLEMDYSVLPVVAARKLLRNVLYTVGALLHKCLRFKAVVPKKILVALWKTSLAISKSFPAVRDHALATLAHLVLIKGSISVLPSECVPQVRWLFEPLRKTSAVATTASKSEVDVVPQMTSMLCAFFLGALSSCRQGCTFIANELDGLALYTTLIPRLVLASNELVINIKENLTVVALDKTSALQFAVEGFGKFCSFIASPDAACKSKSNEHELPACTEFDETRWSNAVSEMEPNTELGMCGILSCISQDNLLAVNASSSSLLHQTVCTFVTEDEGKDNSSSADEGDEELGCGIVQLVSTRELQPEKRILTSVMITNVCGLVEFCVLTRGTSGATNKLSANVVQLVIQGLWELLRHPDCVESGAVQSSHAIELMRSIRGAMEHSVEVVLTLLHVMHTVVASASQEFLDAVATEAGTVIQLLKVGIQLLQFAKDVHPNRQDVVRRATELVNATLKVLWTLAEKDVRLCDHPKFLALMVSLPNFQGMHKEHRRICANIVHELVKRHSAMGLLEVMGTEMAATEDTSTQDSESSSTPEDYMLEFVLDCVESTDDVMRGIGALIFARLGKHFCPSHLVQFEANGGGQQLVEMAWQCKCPQVRTNGLFAISVLTTRQSSSQIVSKMHADFASYGLMPLLVLAQTYQQDESSEKGAAGDVLAAAGSKRKTINVKNKQKAKLGGGGANDRDSYDDRSANNVLLRDAFFANEELGMFSERHTRRHSLSSEHSDGNNVEFDDKTALVKRRETDQRLFEQILTALAANPKNRTALYHAELMLRNSTNKVTYEWYDTIRSRRRTDMSTIFHSRRRRLSLDAESFLQWMDCQFGAEDAKAGSKILNAPTRTSDTKNGNLAIKESGNRVRSVKEEDSNDKEEARNARHAYLQQLREPVCRLWQKPLATRNKRGGEARTATLPTTGRAATSTVLILSHMTNKQEQVRPPTIPDVPNKSNRWSPRIKNICGKKVSKPKRLLVNTAAGHNSTVNPGHNNNQPGSLVLNGCRIGDGSPSNGRTPGVNSSCRIGSLKNGSSRSSNILGRSMNRKLSHGGSTLDRNRLEITKIDSTQSLMHAMGMSSTSCLSLVGGTGLGRQNSSIKLVLDEERNPVSNASDDASMTSEDVQAEERMARAERWRMTVLKSFGIEVRKVRSTIQRVHVTFDSPYVFKAVTDISDDKVTNPATPSASESSDLNEPKGNKAMLHDSRSAVGMFRHVPGSRVYVECNMQKYALNSENNEEVFLYFPGACDIELPEGYAAPLPPPIPVTELHFERFVNLSLSLQLIKYLTTQLLPPMEPHSASFLRRFFKPQSSSLAFLVLQQQQQQQTRMEVANNHPTWCSSTGKLTPHHIPIAALCPSLVDEFEPHLKATHGGDDSNEASRTVKASHKKKIKKPTKSRKLKP